FARPTAAFEHLGSTIPILILGFSIALIWQVAIPRGILQGLQRFTALSLNLSLELVIRTVVVFLLLRAGYAVSGAMAAVFVSQVLFPRVVEAVAKEQHPGRILLSSAGILTALGAGALLVFAVVPGLVVGILFGPSFRDAIPLVFPVGLIGLALALDNLLVQF